MCLLVTFSDPWLASQKDTSPGLCSWYHCLPFQNSSLLDSYVEASGSQPDHSFLCPREQGLDNYFPDVPEGRFKYYISEILQVITNWLKSNVTQAVTCRDMLDASCMTATGCQDIKTQVTYPSPICVPFVGSPGSLNSSQVHLEDLKR